jgi:hypothetical protein
MEANSSMDGFNDIDRELDDRNDGISMDVYGVLGEEMEVDSDVNEDRNREQQLDASFQDWYRNIEHWVHQKEDITQVPQSNVFDVATNMDAEHEE